MGRNSWVFGRKALTLIAAVLMDVLLIVAAKAQEQTPFEGLKAEEIASRFKKNVELRSLSNRTPLRSTEVTQSLRSFKLDTRALFSSYTEGPKAIPQDGVFSTACRLMEIYISDYQSMDTDGAIHIYGATRRAGQIRHFEGEIRIEKILSHYFGGMGADSVGYILIADYQIREDIAREGSGVFAGTYAAQVSADLSYSFLHNKITRIIGIDSKEMASSFYYNRCFAGCWTSYDTGVSIPAIWGDDRLPFTAHWFDIGTDHLTPSEEYTDHEWQQVTDGSRLEPYYNEEGEPMGWQCRNEWWTKE